MPRYWVIAPVESKPSELFEKVWQFDLESNLISIGWRQLGDVSNMSRDRLLEAVATTYPEKPPQTMGLFANMIRAFYHDIRPGDYVIARRGRKMLAGVGRVTGSPFYSPGKSPVHDHPNFIEVTWLDQPQDKKFPGIVFGMPTIAEISEEQFRNYTVGSGPMPDSSAIDSTVEDTNEFVLEKYLEEFIVSNFDAIFKGELRIYEDSEGNDGQQYTTGIGSIDILAIDPKSRAFVVIELKKGRPSDQVVGQILRYMGWVKKNLCSKGEDVKGLVICRESDAKLTYALDMTNNIIVKYYTVSFKLNL